MGLSLGLHKYILDAIEKNHPGDVSRCLTECLFKWLRRANNVDSRGGATDSRGGATYSGGEATYSGGGATYSGGGAIYDGGGATYSGGGATYSGGGATWNSLSTSLRSMNEVAIADKLDQESESPVDSINSPKEGEYNTLL